MRKIGRTAEAMFPRVAQFLQESGDRQAFRAGYGIALSMLCYWRRKYAAVRLIGHPVGGVC